MIDRSTWRWLTVGAVVVGATAVLHATPVAACSCATTTLADEVAEGDASFVGRPTFRRGPGQDGTYLWTFTVEQVLKGDLPAEIVVRGSDWGGMCGVDFGSLPPPILVTVREIDGEYEDPGCTPVGTADDIAALLTPLPAPDGSGPVAAVAALRHRWANLIALDAAGRVLSWGDVGGRLDAVAACAGTSTAVVRRWGGDGPELLAVDLAAMQPLGDPIADPTMMPVDLACVAGGAGGALIVTASRGIESDGRVELGVHDVVRGESRHDTLDAIAAVVAPGGRVVTVPAEPGGAVTSFAASAPDDVRSATLDADESGVAAALTADGARLAVLVAESGRRTSFDTRATAFALFDVSADGTPVRAGTVALPPDQRQALRITWLDPATVAIVATDRSSMAVSVVSLDGTVLSVTDVGWQWGAPAVLGDRLLWVRDGGLMLSDRAGAVTPLTPAPQPDAGGSDGAVTAFADGPVIPARRPDVPALHEPRPQSAAPPTTPAPATTVTAAPTTPATAPAPAATTATETADGGGGGGRGAAIVVVVIAAVLAAGALVWWWRRSRR